MVARLAEHQTDFKLIEAVALPSEKFYSKVEEKMQDVASSMIDDMKKRAKE